MQEVPASTPAEVSTVVRSAEMSSQPESSELPKIIQVFQRAFKRYEDAFDRKRAEGTLSEEDRIGFVATNTEFHNSHGGEKVTVQSFTDADGTRRSIRRNVPLNHILAQLDEDIKAETDEKVKSGLQADKGYLMENSRPLIRNDNRKDLVDRIIDRRAVLIARATPGCSDSDAEKFREQAKHAIENERELVVPNPLVRAAVADVALQPKTIDDLIKRLDVQLPTIDPLRRVDTPRGLDRMRRTPAMEARSAIAENRVLTGLKERQDREAERVRTEKNTAIVRGLLSDARNVVPFDRDLIQDRIAAMNDGVTAMNTAVDTVIEPTANASDQPLQSSEASIQTPPAPSDEVSVDELSEFDMLDPLALADRAAEHPEEFPLEETDAVSAEDVPVTETLPLDEPPVLVTPKENETSENVLTQELQAASPPDPTEAIAQPSVPETVNTAAYVAAHNAGSREATVSAPVVLAPPVKIGFKERVMRVFGLAA